MRKLHAVVIVTLALLLGAAGDALAIDALSLTLGASADCTSSAALNVAWANAGVHSEFGRVTDASGNVIGGFATISGNSNASFSGNYDNPITTAQPNNALIGSYAWVGVNPPTPDAAIEYFVLYNCSTRAVLYRCSGAYGRCPQTAPAAVALVNTPSAVPASSKEMLAALMVLLALAGGWSLRRRLRAHA